MRTVRLLLACLLAVAVAPAAQAVDKPLEAGAAQADITPPIGTPMFAYTARSRVFGPTNNADLLNVLADPDHGLHAKSFVGSTGIHTRLRARALVIERAGVPFALVQADIGGIPHAMSQAVADRVKSTGITEERMLISATHTHSAHGAIWPTEDNSAYGVVGGDLYDHRAWKATVDGLTSAIMRAYADRVVARVGIASTPVFDASNNRASEAFARNQHKPEHAIDPDLTVIRVDAAKGADKPIAVWSNFAIHATSFGDGNRLFSGDNPGYAAEIVQREIGDGVVNVWTNGNEGDISPNGSPLRIGGEPADWVVGDFADAHRAGARVAAGIVRAWEQAGASMRKDVEIQARQSYLAFDGTSADGEPVGPIPVLGAGGIAPKEFPMQCAPVEGMAGPGQGLKYPLFGAPKIIPDAAPVSIWRIGGLGIAALPSEVTRTAGMRIRAAVAHGSAGKVDRVIMAGLTDGYLSYTATPEEFDNCGYEGSMTLFGRRQEPRYRDFAGALSAHLFTGASAPAAAPAPKPTGGEPGVTPTPRTTAEPGKIVAQPAKSVARLGRATFSWQGGDRGVEAPRGKTFVRLQRRSAGKWQTVATDATFKDTVARRAGDVYDETFQFDACDKLGRYRFKVTGRAYDGSRARRYTTVSDPFELTATKLEAEAPANGRFRVRYPSPGEGALIYTPRLLTAGRAEVTEGGTTRFVEPDVAGVFDIGGATLVRVTDGCGNTTA